MPCLGRGLVPADKSVLSREVLQFGQLGAQTVTPLITLVGQQNSGDCPPIAQGDLTETGSRQFWKSFSLEVNYFKYMYIQSFNLPKDTCRKHTTNIPTNLINFIYCLAVMSTETSSWLVIQKHIFWLMWWVTAEAEVDEIEVDWDTFHCSYCSFKTRIFKDSVRTWLLTPFPSLSFMSRLFHLRV